MRRLFGKPGPYFLGAAILCALVSCSDPDSQVERFDRSHWPDAVVGANGVLGLSLPHEPATKYSAEKSALRLSISSDLNPELKFSGAFGRTIYLHVELNTLPVRSEPPPIPHEIVENVRIYSLPWAPRSIKDPQVRQEIYNSMEYARRNKRVRYRPDAPIVKSFLDLRDRAFFGEGEYLPDGKIDGLHRFSSLRCFTGSELAPNPAEPRYLDWKMAQEALRNKASDDPSPAGCTVNRYNTILISAPSEDIETWILIECKPVLQNCVASFIAAERLVEVDFDNYDVQNWRKIVEPVRTRINQLVIP